MNFNLKKFCTILAKKQLKLVDVSKASNISCGTISKYKNGKLKPNLRNIGKLAQALNVSVDEIAD